VYNAKAQVGQFAHAGADDRHLALAFGDKSITE
jgi:hypothetical protein